jgi:glutamate synthase (NADH)
MTLECPVGPEHNLLETSESHARRLMVKSPVLSLDQLAAVRDGEYRGWRSAEIDATYAYSSKDTNAATGPSSDNGGVQSNVPFVRGAGAQMARALDRICSQVSKAIETGEPSVIVLSDRGAGPNRLPIPSLLAAGAVHHHLLRTRQRCQVALFVDSGDACTVHDACTLLGYGVDALCPRHAYEAIASMERDGLAEAAAIVAGRTAPGQRADRTSELLRNYTKAIETGILKVMSKMGISTLRSYKGAQIFEAVGLAEEVIERCFSGTPSRIAGAGWDALHYEAVRKHAYGFPPAESISSSSVQPPTSSSSSFVPLRHTGQFHFVPGAEKHYNDPHGMTMLQEAARTDSRKAYQRYAKHLNELNRGITLRGMLRFVEDHEKSVPLAEVEPASEIVKRFCTGAMSLGSISSEAHETLAVAMNRLGGRSNTGEGGEDPRRFDPSNFPDAKIMTQSRDTKRSAIKQIASGRFGVTSNYLANADQLQIKIAQGAKPGEGGELPGAKVHGLIAETRRVTPGTGLISPPPHHDIYSIEDLAQLIHDLKSSNPAASVSTKLVSEVGVGVVAAGVAKARSDHITVSGGDGGTGAAAWTGIKHAGLPWELGIAETQQTLVLNDLRSRVVLQADGQLKTGRDIVIATLLGAEEFALSTAPLIAMGCIMMRKCHLNTCPVGIATQDPELRAHFRGKPDHVVNFMWLLAEDVREHMAILGYRTVDEMVGHADRLEVDRTAMHYKSAGLDLSAMLVPAGTLNSGAPVRNTTVQDHELETAIDRRLIEGAAHVLEAHTSASSAASALSMTTSNGTHPAQAPVSAPAGASFERVVIDAEINNLDRSTGAWLSNEVSKRFGDNGLPDDSIEVRFQGQAGQSFGFTAAQGVTLRLFGEANDGCGKGLSGGKIIVRPNDEALNRGDIVSEDQIITGNVALYGATSGSAFFRGIAGERFCVRNSGATTVVEGVGDHGCEYMTGGRVVILGSTGNNFGAGMSGGRAFVYDPEASFHQRVNHDMVLLETLDEWGTDEEDELRMLVQEHVDETGSAIGRRILDNWQEERLCFVKVMPEDYKNALLRMSEVPVEEVFA